MTYKKFQAKKVFRPSMRISFTSVSRIGYTNLNLDKEKGLSDLSFVFLII